jgi:hypothetical protein
MHNGMDSIESIFSATQHGANPSLGCLQTQDIWQPLLCQVKCYQKLPHYLGKLKFIFFSAVSCIIVVTWCIAVSVDFPDL